MFHKRHNDKPPPEENELYVPNGNLDPSQIQISLRLHHGIPRTSSKLTFDSVQRLLAIGTLDGRIKLIGTDGIEGILVSDSRSRCKFLEFANNQGFIINVTAENDIEVWNLEKCLLVQTCKWHTNITAFAMIQGTSFMYIGEDTGDVAVLEYNKEESKLCQMPYSISFQAAFGNKGTLGRSSPPSVIDILPFPETNHRRVLLAYSNGLLIVWGLYDAAALSIRGSKADRNDVEYGYHSASDEDAEDKDICCMCWADSSGNLLAVGYTDGDIWIWNVTETTKRSGSHLDSNLPSLKLQLSKSESKSPVLALCWYPSGKETALDVDGYLLVYGGGDFGCSEALMICALATSSELSDSQNVLELSLEGLFDDMILLPKAGGTPVEPVSGFLVLTSQGQLHVYDAISVKEYFEQGSDYVFRDPVLVNPFVTEPIVTVATLCSLPIDGTVADILSQIPHCNGTMPTVLSRGTKWPITGGLINKSFLRGSKVRTILITGHADGSINVWDATSCAVSRICSVSQDINLKMDLPENAPASVSNLEFSPHIGILVVAHSNGLVLIYNLSSTAGEVRCCSFMDSEIQEQLLLMGAGFQCTIVLNLKSVVSSIAITDNQKHVCIGYSNGMVLIFDVHTCTIIAKTMVLSDSNKHITSLSFATQISMFTSEVSVVDSSRSDSSSSSLPHGVIYIIESDTSLIALAYTKEAAIICGRWHIDDASKVLYHCCLDVGKMGAFSLDNSKSSMDILDEGISSRFLLVCTENVIYLYGCITSNQSAELKKLKTESFSIQCRHAKTFVNENTDAYGLIVLYVTGTLEIRSLPDFSVIKQLSLANVYNLDPKLSESPMFVCGDRGLIAFVDVKRELVLISILASDELAGTEDRKVYFFDKDLSAAADAAFKAIARPAHQKTQVQNFIGGVLKDIKGGVIKKGFLKNLKDRKESSGINTSMGLPELFSSTTVEHISSPEPQKPSDSKTVAVEMELSIDDIDIDDDDSSFRDSPGSSEQHSANFQGKGRFSDPIDDRAKLFSGEEGYSKPVRLSLDEIKAKYGRRTAGDVAGAAGLARDKLLERQEKLEALNKRTEELEQGAENFASLAAELAKAMEKKKWWQI